MIVDRKIAPAITNTVDLPLQLKPYSFFELDNKVPVYAIEAGAQDVVMLELVFELRLVRSTSFEVDLLVT